MSTYFKLRNLAILRTGYSFRGRIESAEEGDFLAVQLKNIDMDEGLKHEELTRTTLPGRAPSMLLENGDIAFVARGNRNYAVCAKDISSPTVLSQHFIHMRIQGTKQIFPEYLTWYLNTAYSAKRHLRKAAQGTALPTITRAMLENMPIELPDLKTQQKIVAIHETHLLEKQLLQKLIENNSVASRAMTNQLLKELKP